LVNCCMNISVLSISVCVLLIAIKMSLTHCSIAVHFSPLNLRYELKIAS
jgi:hypothetical protein